MSDSPHQRALVSVRASVRGSESVTLFVRSHHVTVGAPLSFDVAEPMPTAVEHLLAAVAADVLGGFRRLAGTRRLAVDAVEATLQAVIADPLVYLGVVGEEGTPRLSSLTLRAYIDTGEPHERLAEVWKENLRRAPIVNTLRPGVAMEIGFQITA